MKSAILLAPLLVAASTLTANAQDGDRYRLERTDDGFVRMDTDTGEMSFCSESAGVLTCRPASAGETAQTGELAALQERIDELEARVEQLEGGTGAPPQNALPTDEEFEQTMGLMERFLRRFMGIVKDLEGEEQRDPAPDRT